MSVTVSPEAIADLASINGYVGARNPRAATFLVTRLLEAFDSLEQFPSRGRHGVVQGTRELTTVWPYIIVYEVEGEDVEVLRVRHGVQDWP